MPDRAPGARIEGVVDVIGSGQVHDAIHDQRRAFELSSFPGLEDPLRGQALHVACVDLIQSAKALSGIVARIDEPVLRLPGGIQNAIEGDLRRACVAHIAIKSKRRRRSLISPHADQVRHDVVHVFVTQLRCVVSRHDGGAALLKNRNWSFSSRRIFSPEIHHLDGEAVFVQSDTGDRLRPSAVTTADRFVFLRK